MHCIYYFEFRHSTHEIRSARTAFTLTGVAAIHIPMCRESITIKQHNQTAQSLSAMNVPIPLAARASAAAGNTNPPATLLQSRNSTRLDLSGKYDCHAKRESTLSLSPTAMIAALARPLLFSDDALPYVSLRPAYSAWHWIGGRMCLFCGELALPIPGWPASAAR